MSKKPKNSEKNVAEELKHLQGGRRPQPSGHAKRVSWIKNLRKKARFSHILAQERFAEVEKSRKKFEDLFDSAPIGCCSLDKTGKIEEINLTGAGLIGRSREKLTGKQFHLFIDKKDRSIFNSNLTKVLSGTQSTTQLFIAQPDGGKIPVEFFITPSRNEEGEIKGCRLSMRDITVEKGAEQALKESERRLKESQEIARLGQWELDLVSNKLYWSEGIYNLFEVDPADFGASYEAFLERVHPDDREFVDKAYTDSVKNKVPYDIVHRLLLKDGTVKYVNEICRTEYDKEGKPLRSLGTVQDITELKRAEEQVKAALEEKELLLKEIHHRVKNNLQIISSLLYLQSKHVKDKDTLKIFKNSQERIRAMAFVHEKLYQSEDLAKVNFQEYTENLVKSLFASYSLEAGRVKLKIDIEDVDLNIKTAIPLGLIINELVSNSLKHAFPGRKKGEVQIILRENKDEEEDFNYILVVSDNGVSFPEGVDFSQGDSLGTLLVNSLVKQLHGVIDLDRKNGAKITIKFKKMVKFDNN